MEQHPPTSPTSAASKASSRYQESYDDGADIDQQHKTGEEEEICDDDSGDEENKKNTTTTTNNTMMMDRYMESLVRITFASFGGMLIGLSRAADEVSSSSSSEAAAASSYRRRGVGRTSLVESSHLPRTWALACTIFTAIIETSRLTSPTSKIYDNFFVVNTRTDPSMSSSSWTGGTTTSSVWGIPRNTVITVGDYVVGGMSAGLAGSYAMAKRRSTTPMTTRGVRHHPSSPTSSIATLRHRTGSVGFGAVTLLWGIAMGGGLGLLGGISQAGVDAVGEYASERKSMLKERTTTTITSTEKRSEQQQQ